jgi:GNAT superfamily N-acetyltransferase
MLPADPVVVRPTSPADAVALRDLRLEALRAHPVAFTADLPTAEARPAEWWLDLATRGAGDGPAVVHVADVGGRLVGMAGVYVPAEPKLSHAGTVWGVYVGPEARGRGVGASLVRACVAWAARRGLATLRLSATLGDGTPQRCYERCGFTAYGTEPMAVQWEDRFYDETLMVLRLRDV